MEFNKKSQNYKMRKIKIENNNLINFAGIKIKNPVMTASGTFGYGVEFAELIDLNQIGAIVTKTITLEPRWGNEQPRLYELPYGLMNTIGLQNVGLENFISEKLPALKKMTTTPVIVSVGGNTITEFIKIINRLNKESIAGIELNISCPNVKTGTKSKGCMYLTISQNAKKTFTLVSAIRKKTKLPLIVKLSPNVTDVAEIAVSAEKAGANALALINTFPAMSFIGTAKTRMMGGLSGPCIKPLALRMVYVVSQAVKIPILGMGGIMNSEDAKDFLHAGAKAIAVGTGNFVDPKIIMNIINDFKKD